MGLLGALTVGASIWLIRSAFLPLERAGRIEYLFLSAPFRTLLIATVASVGAVTLLHVARTRSVFRRARDGRRPGLRCWWPLFLLWLPFLPLLSLAPGAGEKLSVWSYLFADLRVWWWLAATALAAWEIDRQASGRLSGSILDFGETLSAAAKGILFEVSLVGIAVVVAIAGAPHLRFSAALHGDEPKYVRYCENFYQGLGFEVGRQQPMSALPLTFSSRPLANIRHLAAAVPEELWNLSTDLRTILRDGVPERFNRGRHLEAWFMEGKNGGIYQVHNPGLSLLMFPAYFIDRHFLSFEPGYQNAFPADLPATNLFFLALYATWGVVIFRFLRNYTGRAWMSWGLALTALLTLPVAAFPFQLYPEIAAGVLIFAVANRIVFYGSPGATPARRCLAASLEGRGASPPRRPQAPRSAAAAGAFAGRDESRPYEDTRAAADLFYGTLAGFLPWLHVRFLLISVILAAWIAVARRRQLRHAALFLAPYAALLGCLALYAYRLTGSLMPDAMYSTEGSVTPFHVQRLREGLIGYAFDRTWGLLPHAPIYLLAIPGVWLLVGRQPTLAVFVGLIAVALAVPSAAHTFTAAGATPLRHLVAIVPLAMVPLAETLGRWGRERWCQAAFALLLIVSLDNSLSYNWHHVKEVGRMVDSSFSGWKSNLLFPWTHGVPWQASSANYGLFLAWVAICAILFVMPLWSRRSHPHSLTSRWRPANAAAALLIAVGIFGLLGSAAAALTGEWFRRDYLMSASKARTGAIEFFLRLDRCAVCVSSWKGEVDEGTLVPNALGRLRLSLAPPELTEGAEANISVRATTDDGEPAWGTVRIDFGDGQTLKLASFFGAAEARHRYERPGVYPVAVHLELPSENARLATERAQIIVRERRRELEPPLAPPLDGLVGLPAGIGDWPETSRITEVFAQRADLQVVHTQSGAWPNEAAWLLRRVNDHWQAVRLQPDTTPRRERLQAPASVERGETRPRSRVRLQADANVERGAFAGAAPAAGEEPSDGGRRFRFGPPAAGEWVGLLLSDRGDGSPRRTEVVMIRWPRPEVTIGGAVQLVATSGPRVFAATRPTARSS